MRFLLDMGIPPLVARVLVEKGHEAHHLTETGLHRLPDDEILAKARRESSVVLTHDLDFGDLLASSGAFLPSVVIFRLSRMRPENVLLYLDRVLSTHLDALVEGAIISINERRMRVRSLPIRT